MDFFSNTPALRILAAGVTIFLITLLARWLLYRFIPPLLARQSPLWEPILKDHRVLHYLTLSVPGFLLAGLVQISPDINTTVASAIYKFSIIYGIIMVTVAISATLLAYNDFYDQYYEFANEVPIKTLIQTGVVLVVVFSIMIIVAILLEVPLLALAGLIAAAGAIAYYLFREPLLGFTASLQLSMNHMLAIGDWLEMRQFGADGLVEDINVTSTKVRNWDNSIVNIPTNSLIKNPFQNWRSMQDEGARRINQPIYIDQNTISFVSQEQKAQQLARISELYEKLPEGAEENVGMLGVHPQDLQDREQLNNLELFMAYATQIIAAHPQTRTDYDIYVRQQAPTPQGLPVETFFFTRATEFVPYHAVQREIFSHLLAVLPEFGLRPYQTLDTSND